MDIPYTSEVRPDTGVTSQTLGMWLFLASEVMLFGSLFSSYALLRSGATSWPHQSATVNVRLATVNTIVLVASSITILGSSRSLRAGRVVRFRRLMASTAALGIVFLAIKTAEYRGELAEGLRPSTNNFLGLYFVMTSVHASHVLCGVAVNAYLCGPGSGMRYRDPARFAGRVKAAALYWNFIDAVWILMFVVLYLL